MDCSVFTKVRKRAVSNYGFCLNRVGQSSLFSGTPMDPRDLGGISAMRWGGDEWELVNTPQAAHYSKGFCISTHWVLRSVQCCGPNYPVAQLRQWGQAEPPALFTELSQWMGTKSRLLPSRPRRAPFHLCYLLTQIRGTLDGSVS